MAAPFFPVATTFDADDPEMPNNVSAAVSVVGRLVHDVPLKRYTMPLAAATKTSVGAAAQTPYNPSVPFGTGATDVHVLPSKRSTAPCSPTAHTLVGDTA